MSENDSKRPHGETGDSNRVLGNQQAARVPPASKTGTDTRQNPGGGGNVSGPGGPDSGSNAMPGRSNAL